MTAILATAVTEAHPLAPVLLELRETESETYTVQWRASLTRAQRADVQPVFPENCVVLSPAATAVEEEALVTRWTLRCAGGLAGRALAVSGLAGSGINVIVRHAPLGGTAFGALLDAGTPQVTVPAAAAASVFPDYLALGAGHLLLGLDHLLLVAGLVLLLAARWRALVLTVTAFTLGHSLTLGLATLGWIGVNAPLMELGIALSILMLAVELTRATPGLLGRWPLPMGLAFGLLHGLGFASALAEVGLPQGEIPLALFAFNLGIELGQLAVIAALLVLAAVFARMPRLSPAFARVAAVYLIGSLAAFWCFERAATLLSA